MQVVVLGDSLTFHNQDGRLRLDDPRLFPNRMARAIEADCGEAVEVHVVARAGWTTRDAWELVTKDVWFQEHVLPGADVIVIGCTGADGLPVGIPTWLKNLIPRVPAVRPRRALRRAYRRTHPPLVRLTRGRMRMVPRSVTRDLWPRLVDMLRFYSDGALVVAPAPSPSRGSHHAGADPHSAALCDEVRAMAAAKDVPFAEVYGAYVRNLPRFNVDGIHWDDATHAEVGAALAAIVLENVPLEKRPLPVSVRGRSPE